MRPGTNLNRDGILKKKIIFSLIPAILLFGSLEIVCLIWERVEKRAAPLQRSVDELPKKEEGEFRVLFYGGSTVNGGGEPRVGFVAQMEAYLAEINPGRRIRFFNYSGPGEPSTYVVRNMARTVPGSEADAIVVLTAHNEFYEPADMSEEELNSLYAIQENMHRSALVRRARRLVYRYYTARRADVLSGDNLSRFDRNSARFKERVALYQRNCDTIVRLAREESIPLFLCTGPCNLADWPPSSGKYSAFAENPDYEPAVGKIHALLLEGKNEEVLAFGAEALQRFPDDALLTYGMGKAQLALGAREEARELLYRARDLDPIPFRVLSEFNEVVREKEDQPGVNVVDLERILDARSPKGITGYEFMVDICHPNPEGAYLIATALIDRFGEEGLVDLEKPAGQLADLDRFLHSEGRMEDWTEFLLETARTAMKPPYHNMREAERSLKEALDRDPDHWEVLANVATIFFSKGMKAQGEQYLRKAVEKKGAAIDLNDREAVPYLKEAMEGAGYQVEK